MNGNTSYSNQLRPIDQPPPDQHTPYNASTLSTTTYPSLFRLSDSQLPGLGMQVVQNDFLESSANRVAEHSHPSSTALFTSQPIFTGGSTQGEPRDVAKRAIMELLPYRVGFQQYLAAGVKQDILEQLYRELGLEVPQSYNQGHAERRTAEKPSSDLKGNSNPISSTAQPATAQKSESDPNPNTTPTYNVIPPTSNFSLESSSTQTLPTETRFLTTVAKQLPPPTLKSASFVSTANRQSNSGLLSASLLEGKGDGSHVARKDVIRQKLAARTKTAVGPRTETQKLVDEKDSQHSNKASQPAPEVFKFKALSGGESSNRAPDVSRTEQQKTEVTASTSTNSGDLTLEKLREAIQSARLGRPHFRKSTPSEAKDSELSLEHSIPNRQTDNSQETLMATSTQSHSQRSLEPDEKGDFQGFDTFSPRSSIPGLFMTAPSYAPTNSVLTTSASQPKAEASLQSSSRKRPVAADFDEEPLSAAGPIKRSFGSRKTEESLVIDVSEDEKSAEDMETDSTTNGTELHSGQINRAQKLLTDQKRLSIRDMPPLPDFPTSSKVRTQNGLGRTLSPATPSVDSSGAKAKPAAKADLRRTEEEIRLMQKRIAEYESRKASQSKSGAQTPIKTNQLPLRSKPQTPASAIIQFPPPAIDQLIKESSRGEEDSQKELAAEHAAEVKAEQMLIQAKNAERDRRRSEIQSGLSQTQMEVEQERRKLNEIQAERAKREALFQQALLRKQSLEEELTRMDIDGPSLLPDRQNTESQTGQSEEQTGNGSAGESFPSICTILATYCEPTASCCGAAFQTNDLLTCN